jgi:hypothetical protein
MTSPTPRAVLGTASATTDSTSFTVNLPTHAAGDTLFVFISSDGTGAVLSCAGWELLAVWGSTTSKGHLFRRATVAASNAETNPVFTSTVAEQYAAIAYSVIGSELLNLQYAATSGASASPDAPNLNISGGPLDPLLVVFYAFDGNANMSVAPSGYGGLVNASNANATGASAMSAYKTATSVNSENPGAGTSTSEQWAAFTIAIYETPPPAPPPAFKNRGSRMLMTGVGGM